MPEKKDDSPTPIGRYGRSESRGSTITGRDGPADSFRSGPRPRRALASIGRLLTVAALLTVVVAASLATWAGTRLRPVDASDTAAVTFEIEPGWDAARVASELEAASLIRDAWVFTLYLRVEQLDRSIGEGLFDLSPALSARETAAALAAGGRPRTVRLVIPEGWRATDVATRLEALGIGTAEQVLGLVEQPGELAPPWLPAGAGLEGYLFPDTYELRADATPSQALAVAVEHFTAQIDVTRERALREAGLTVHEWTTLASMVQAEADGPSEMGIIAGVFRNRLDLGMRLQSDPTVAYGLGKRLPELSAVAGDLRVDHPWNTYTRAGLPVGPIGNPGLAALDSVLEPQRERSDGSPWLYFLHGVDEGQPVFRPNIDRESHERDVDSYLR